MRSKKAKLLHKIAKSFVIQTRLPLSSIQKEYKKMKNIYKKEKGEI